jgi:hypothetical protein
MTKEEFEKQLLSISQMNATLKTKISLVKRLLAELDKGSKH